MDKFVGKDSFDFDECQCDCHTNPCVMHCMPCCHVCPHCGKNIKLHAYEEHIEECEENKDKHNNEILNIIKTIIKNKEIPNGTDSETL